MSRQSFAHAAVVTLSTGLAFFVHACAGGRPLKENLRVGEVASPPTVQVGLGRCLRDASVRIAVRGPWKLGTTAEGDDLPWTEVRSPNQGVIDVVGRLLYKSNPLTLTAEIDGSIEVEYTRDAKGNAVKPSVVRYPGSLILHSLPGGKLAVVNEVDLEEYLKGVVGKEMNLSEGVEALKTQVIAARTYAVHEQQLDRLRRVKGEKFDLYDDERSQVYGGKERATGFASKLVDETRGMFLVYEGKLVRTFYSSACGGYTEPAWEVLSDETDKIPPLGGRKCEYCQRRAIHRWKEPVVVSKKEIAEKCLPRELQGARVRSVEVTKTLPGGHALEIAVKLENSSRVVRLHAANEFRRPLSARMRSTLWDKIEDRGDSIAIYGRGYGHGAGMCQVGAYEMAKDGKTAAEILEYYFPSAKVQKLY